MTIRYLIVEGIDSTGKTTFVEKLAKQASKHVEVQVINDLRPNKRVYFNMWLNRYVKDGLIQELDPVSQAALFAIAAKQNDLRLPHSLTGRKLYIIDRSVISSLLYAAGLIYLKNYYNQDPGSTLVQDLSDIAKARLNDDDVEYGELHRTLRVLRTTYLQRTSDDTINRLDARALVLCRCHVYGREESPSDIYEDKQLQLVVKDLFRYYLDGPELKASQGSSFENAIYSSFSNRVSYDLVKVDIPFFTIDDGDKYGRAKIPVIRSYNADLDFEVAKFLHLIQNEEFWASEELN
ncbi:nucleoside/nucleotide kinase family protein [Psittacicella hinzii]|uniref:Thymidylate kinase-like domain-containing protein n=1 Tax=Psittacicella hinzii TaxID=2028575 RepID=A0A3A1YBF4_9GAMM|nr:hypothetical protein [Psittacicella hinzii]RIY34891.1 hypothetical protein CKF58_07385 [Psittacicella hinzii]